MTDEHEQPPELSEETAADDLRFAPPAEDEIEAVEAADEPLPLEDVSEDEDAPEAEVDLPDGELTTASEVDLDAALAAISALDDMLAEQEAAEQAEVERERAEEEALAVRQARIRSPELFFPMPPMATLQRGRIDSVVPALALIGLGAWLTLAVTTGGGMASLTLLIPVIAVGLSVTLLARWLGTGRWALGALFFALTLLLSAGLFIFLVSQGRLLTDWPLLIAGPGIAFFVSGVLARDSRLLLPGILTAAAGLIGMVVTNGLLPGETLAIIARLWPLIIVILLVLLALPFVGRRRREP